MPPPCEATIPEPILSQRWRQLWPLLILLASLAGLATPLCAQADGEPAGSSELEARHQYWLEEVEPLLSEAERKVWEELEANYQRDHFIREFWRVRDPYPKTGRNELRERWQARVEVARDAYADLSDPRAQILLQLGEPSRRRPPSCSDLLRPLEIWIYDHGSDFINGYFTVVFVGTRGGRAGKARLWQPADGLASLVVLGTVSMADPQLARQIRQGCTRGDELLADFAQALEIAHVESRLGALIPRPSAEWVASFRARSTQLKDDAESLAGRLEIAFPGRHQSRTIVQGLLSIPAAAATVGELGSLRVYNFLIDGEVLRQGELFDHFRYRFALPAKEITGDQLPLILQRYLRPGDYTLILKAEDIHSGRAFRIERPLRVPKINQVKPPPVVAVGSTTAERAAADGRAVEVSTRLLGGRLAEANASLGSGDHLIRILPLPAMLSVGRLRIEAETTGEGIAKVAFELDGRPVMRKSRPPYSVELNLGEQPRTHELRVLALDSDGKVLAIDQAVVNAGPHRFAIRLLEPQLGKTYRRSVRAQAEVEVPEGERLERVEFYINETLLASLYQAPWEQPMLLPPDEEVTYVRAVAHLRGGSSVEDVVFINAPDYVDHLDVRLVELYTSVVDRKGRAIRDLRREEITVLEDGVQQEIQRFEEIRDQPIHTGIVLDTSISMVEELAEVEKAAYRFLETVLTPRDRAAVITFADEPKLVTRFTADREVLAGGLVGLVADGETALYDSLIYALHYFSGLPGKRALIVLTDGADSVSHYGYEDVTDFAHRTGVAIYMIGLDLNSRQMDIRVKMQRLARSTGGNSFFIESASQLGSIYDKIQEELRAQYLIAYQAPGDDQDARFRQVEVRLSRKGLKAKTIQGYFP